LSRRPLSRLLSTLALLALAAAAACLPLSGRRREEFLCWWCGRLARTLGLRIRVFGSPRRRATMFAANHVSWLDIIALAAVRPTGFVAKAEVGRWPLVGWVAGRFGTIFIKRGSAPDAARVAWRAAARLREGRSVAVFPEGTSTLGASVRPFHAALYEASVRSGRPLQSVAIRYPYRRGLSLVAPFIGEDAFLPHLLRLLREPEIPVELHFAPPLPNACGGRRALARLSQEQVEEALAGPAPVAAA
jgi:1-acyl-sn-glycerol-3-phosphate acyltransferase